MNKTAPTGLLQQPRPFFMIFFVELWERFGYYGVQGILAVFFVKQLGFSPEQAFVTFGAFAALVYGLISIGGYVGDHLLGTKRTLVLGAIVLAIGYFMTGMSPQSLRPTDSSAASAFSLISVFEYPPRISIGSRRFSLTVRHGNKRSCCGMYPQ